MVRRCTTTLLMMVFLANQLAVVPHAHGDSSECRPSDHDARLHVHTHVLCADHAEHSHRGGHTHGRDCGESHSEPSRSESAPEHDHDSDAVYLPNDTGGSLPAKSIVLPHSFQVVSTLAVAATLTPMAISESWAAADFPDKCSPGCPLYLALRALRI